VEGLSPQIYTQGMIPLSPISDVLDRVTGVVSNVTYVQVHIGTMRATSRGQLTLQSADPTKAPVLDFNYLATEDDIRDLRACIPIARQVCTALFIIVLHFLLLVKL